MKAWTPWVILTVFVFIWGLPVVKNFLNGLFMPKFAIDGLHKLVEKMPPVVPTPTTEGAEYVLNLLPRGTHEYLKFIRPAELASYSRDAGLQWEGTKGLSYNPLTRRYRLGDDTSVNYWVATRKA